VTDAHRPIAFRLLLTPPIRLTRFKDNSPVNSFSALSARSEATTRRTYNRPLDDAGSKFETWADTMQRSHYDHHKRLWEDAGGHPDLSELDELLALGLNRSGLVSGRTMWLGGTEYAYSRAASQFNCSALSLSTVFDMVDAFWLLLNGCGVGGQAKCGTLHGYYRRIGELKIIPSEREKDFRGHKENRETLPSEATNWTWTITVGDSAEAWAKAGGKMLASPRGRCDRLVLDFSNVRGPGGRLKGYGWICNGYKPMADAMEAIHAILNRQSGNLLDEEDILDIFNWFGTVLSSRRAAESGLMSQFNPRVKQFASRKQNYWQCKACGSHNTRGGTCLDCGARDTNIQRRQSNNSIMFWTRPSIDDIADLLYMNLDGGEPGFVNAAAALNKCVWFENFNPCVPGDTLITTRDGDVRIDSVVGKQVEVWNGEEWATVTPSVTGYNQPLIKITLADGRSLTCTPAHKWVVESPVGGSDVFKAAGELNVGDSVVSYPTTKIDALYSVNITSIDDAGFADTVYCFTEPKTHRGTFNGIVTGQCFEICLPNTGFCNLVSLCIPLFKGDFSALERATWVMARANYRQTCVNLEDGVLQRRWHQTNEALRLCGVSYTGIVQAPWLTDYQIRRLRNSAIVGAYSMADELGLPRPKAVTTLKPEGTRTKIAGHIGAEHGEGMHMPLGRYIFNWINFAVTDPFVGALEAAGYKVLPNPSDTNNVLVRFPIAYPQTGFTNVGGKWVNTESSIDQLNRYRRWNKLWADHNVSATINMSREEVPATAKWVFDNWEDDYVATAFMPKIDPTKSAKDAGQPYLPQEVVTEESYYEVESQLKAVEWDRFHTGWFEISDSTGCEATGVCPVK
jgi:hypothetical protein